MSERRYTDEDVAAIFEQAAEAGHADLPVPAAGKDMTLAALREIGREVGISPESISHAARSLDLVGRPALRRFMGRPIGVGRTVELDRPLSDSDWERLVADLRETFEARGVVKYDSPFRQWTNGNLQALVEPTPSGHRFRLQTVKGDSRGSLGNSGSVVGVEFLAAMGLGMFAVGAVRLPGWARLRRTQIEAVTARLAIAAETPSRDDRKPERDPS